MAKCALVIGHKPGSPGAVNKTSGTTEFELNDGLATEIIAAIDGVEVEKVYRDTYSGLPDKINALNPDFTISMHCNAFNKKAGGSEVLYYHTSLNSHAIAAVLQEKFVNNLGVKDRGAKPKTVEDRGGYLLYNTKSPCVIAEPFFIDNDEEFEQVVKQQRGELVQAYVSAITEVAALFDE